MSKFTPEQFQDYLKKIREMAEGPFEEMEPEVEQTDRFPQRFFDLVQESGIYRCALPEEYGGYGMNDLELVKVQEEYSRGPGGMRMYLHYAMGMNWRILHDFAGAEMKKEFMPKFQDATVFTCFGLTEETGGTGADLHTTAVLDGDEYVINGEKTLISYAQYCNYAYVFAVTNSESNKDDRLSAFLVPMDTPGMEVLPMPRPMGCRGAGYGKLRFTNLRLPKKFLIGQEGQGLHIAVHSLAVSRAHVGVSNLGIAQRMMEISIARAKDRVTFGKPLAKRQMIQSYIAEMGTYINALRTMLYDFARDFDAGKEHETKAAMAKYFSILTVQKVSDYMLLIFGGIGYFEDCKFGPVERLYRDCRVTWLEEGPPTVLKLTAARGLLQSNGVLEYLD
ncbi:MAG: acyl-CoA/acyl-ACP dehydrogenase [Clostridiales bacterium]|jgi:alkylation response protein AidB-like acyl-CoA dehydrogenase|nr:acyl-CoA/acyl-ACP dehydrogenase [Clostridiales bacterium]